jgi:hypothetical protein
VFSLKEWFVAIALGFICIGTAKAEDSILECVSKGRLAASLVYAMSDGTDLASINVNFQSPPRNSVEEFERDTYVAGVKAEIVELLDGAIPPVNDHEFAGKIGVKVAERCAVEYGMKRGDFKRTATVIDNDAPLEGVIAVRPLTATGSAHPHEPAASSRSIQGPPIGMEEACSNLAFDIKTIGRAVYDGVPKQQLQALANKSLPQLGEERLARILRQIDEAYAHEGPLLEWMNKEFAECRGGK